MARSRNIKPGFFSNEQVGECSDGARLLFLGLWTLADYRGVLEWRPKKIHAELFPYDRRNMEKLVTELEAQKLVVRSQKNDKSFLLVCAFEKHQNPHRKEKDRGTDMPDPCEFRCEPGQDPAQTGSNTELAGLIPDSLIPDPETLNPNTGAGSGNHKDLFEEFWAAYPKKQSKKDAEKAFRGIPKLTDALSKRIVEKVELFKRTEQWRKDNGKFVPLPATFIRGERWEDEPTGPKIIEAEQNYRGGTPFDHD